MAPDQELPEREQRVADLLAQARAGTRAPESLRARVGGLQPRRQPRTRIGLIPRWRAGLGAMATAAVALAVFLAVVIGHGSSGPVNQADVLHLAQLAGRGPAGPAPGPDRSDPATLLAASVAGLHFPNWEAQSGWRASGERVDRIAGRRVTTVYYRRGRQRLVYSIAPPPALPWPKTGGRYVLVSFAARVRGAPHGGVRNRNTVVWWYEGHTCALSAIGISGASLWRLARTTLA